MHIFGPSVSRGSTATHQQNTAAFRGTHLLYRPHEATVKLMLGFFSSRRVLKEDKVGSPAHPSPSDPRRLSSSSARPATTASLYRTNLGEEPLTLAQFTSYLREIHHSGFIFTQSHANTTLGGCLFSLLDEDPTKDLSQRRAGEARRGCGAMACGSTTYVTPTTVGFKR